MPGALADPNIAPMPPDDSSLPTQLRDALVELTPDRPGALERLRALYADDMVFRDPIQLVHGLESFMAMNRRLLHRMRWVEWRIETSKGDDEEVFLAWRMRGAPKLGPTFEVEGVTRARARGGRIFAHRDYWDLGELVTSPIPGGQRLLRALLSPIA